MSSDAKVEFARHETFSSPALVLGSGDTIFEILGSPISQFCSGRDPILVDPGGTGLYDSRVSYRPLALDKSDFQVSPLGRSRTKEFEEFTKFDASQFLSGIDQLSKFSNFWSD
jgi:hypothetical protein